ncbi:MAG TPA: O-antigen ligase family protein [Dongiaceae bacterium]|nr:O-antigen ligase family protein [Dongiaceae bacterium]
MTFLAATRPQMPDASPAAPAAATDAAPGLPRVYAAYLKYTVVFWLTGALIPGAAFVLFKLVAAKWPRGRAINIVIFSWLSISLAQASCSILNGILLGDPLLGLRNAFSFTVIGWIFGALAIAAGSAWNLANRPVADLVARLGGYILLLGLVAVAARLAGFTNLRTLSPLGLLLPGGNAAKFYTSIIVFQREETLGEATTRLVLFFPWATALGLGGIAIALISSRATSLGWRLTGIVGGLVGVVFSWSRLAIAAVVLVGAFLIFLRLPRFWQILAVGGGLALLCLLPTFGIDPIALVSDVHHAADKARAGSSLARDLIYQKSWEGFLTSPIIGHGWIGESVHRIEDLPIGSHSTIYGLLYTGGIVTMGCFALAMAATLGALLYGLYRRRDDRDALHDGVVSLCLFLTLLVFCPYESLFSLTLPAIYLFTWIGGGIPSGPDTAPAESGLRPSAGRRFSLDRRPQRHFESAPPARTAFGGKGRRSPFTRDKQALGTRR